MRQQRGHLSPVCPRDRHLERSVGGPVRSQLDLRHDEQHRQVVPVSLEQRRRVAAGASALTRAPSEVPMVLS